MTEHEHSDVEAIKALSLEMRYRIWYLSYCNEGGHDHPSGTRYVRIHAMDPLDEIFSRLKSAFDLRPADFASCGGDKILTLDGGCLVLHTLLATYPT